MKPRYKKPRYHLLTTTFLAVLLIAGCDSSVTDDSVELSFELQPIAESTPLVTGSQVYSINGRPTTIESARFYISDITLLRSDGTETKLLADQPLTTVARDASGADVPYTVEDEIVLVKHDLGESDYHIGEVEPGDFNGIRFKVGIDGLANKVDASQIDPSNPLGMQTDRGNHWSWNAGYIFLRLDGQTDADDDGTPESRWEVHLGTGNFLNTVTLDHDFTLEAGEPSNLHIIVDYSKFLEGLDFSDPTQRLCHTMDNLPVAQVVSGNIADAFTFHGVHAGTHSD